MLTPSRPGCRWAGPGDVNRRGRPRTGALDRHLHSGGALRHAFCRADQDARDETGNEAHRHRSAQVTKTRTVLIEDAKTAENAHEMLHAPLCAMLVGWKLRGSYLSFSPLPQCCSGHGAGSAPQLPATTRLARAKGRSSKRRWVTYATCGKPCDPCRKGVRLVRTIDPKNLGDWPRLTDRRSRLMRHLLAARRPFRVLLRQTECRHSRAASPGIAFICQGRR